MSQPLVVLLSGATRGIGLAIAKKLYAQGYRLSLGARKPQALQALCADWDPKRLHITTYDAKTAANGKHWVEQAQQHYGQVDVLINCAGIVHRMNLENYDEDLLDEMWEVNVKAPIRIIRAAWPYLKQSEHARVINISSLSGKRVRGGSFCYPMTKHALMALTHSLRAAGWDDKIRCTAICPGYVKTNMTSMVTSIPQEQMLEPETIAEVVATTLALPNECSVAEIPVNCQLEDLF